MDHQDIKDKLSEFYDGELGARDAQAVEVHLAACAECTAQIQRFKMLSEQIIARPKVQVGEFFVSQVMRRIDSLEAKKAPLRIVPIPWFAPLLGMAAMLLLTIVPSGEV